MIWATPADVDAIKARLDRIEAIVKQLAIAATTVEPSEPTIWMSEDQCDEIAEARSEDAKGIVKAKRQR